METVVIITFKIKGFPEPIKIASQNEPQLHQITTMLSELAETKAIDGEIKFKKLLKDHGQKMFIYEIGDRKCVVIVEKLERIMHFDR